MNIRSFNCSYRYISLCTPADMGKTTTVVELQSRIFEYSHHSVGMRGPSSGHRGLSKAKRLLNCHPTAPRFFNSPVTGRNQTKSLMKCSETCRTHARCCCCSPGQWLPRRRIVTKTIGMYAKYYYFLNLYKFWHMKFRFVYNQDGRRKTWNPPSRRISQSIQSSGSHYQWRTGLNWQFVFSEGKQIVLHPWNRKSIL
jgi:hypothetical protein